MKVRTKGMPYSYHHIYELSLCEMEAEDKQLYKNTVINQSRLDEHTYIYYGKDTIIIFS